MCRHLPNAPFGLGFFTRVFGIVWIRGIFSLPCFFRLRGIALRGIKPVVGMDQELDGSRQHRVHVVQIDRAVRLPGQGQAKLGKSVKCDGAPCVVGGFGVFISLVFEPDFF